MNILTEKEVGISEYCGSHKGFQAIIKQRFVQSRVRETVEDTQTNL